MPPLLAWQVSRLTFNASDRLISASQVPPPPPLSLSLAISLACSLSLSHSLSTWWGSSFAGAIAQGVEELMIYGRLMIHDLGPRRASSKPCFSFLYSSFLHPRSSPLCPLAKHPFVFVYSSILGDIRLWVGPKIEHLLSTWNLTRAR